MGTKQQIVAFLLEQSTGVPVPDATVRKMFGEYALYSTGKAVAPAKPRAAAQPKAKAKAKSVIK